MASMDFNPRSNNQDIGTSRRQNQVIGMDFQENRKPQLFEGKRDIEDHETRYKKLVYDSLNDYEGRLTLPTTVHSIAHFYSRASKAP
jgi:hypothetical protein